MSRQCRECGDPRVRFREKHAMENGYCSRRCQTEYYDAIGGRMMTDEGNRELVAAAGDGDAAKIRTLLENYAFDGKTLNDALWKAMHKAAVIDMTEVVRVLLESFRGRAINNYPLLKFGFEKRGKSDIVGMLEQHQRRWEKNQKSRPVPG